MAEYFPKYYKITDLDRLADIRSWAMQISNRAQIIEERLADSCRYLIVVQDALGMAAVSPAFESEFGTSVESWTPGA